MELVARAGEAAAPIGHEGLRASLASRFIAFVRSNPLYVGLLSILSLAFFKNSPLLLQDLPDWVQQGQQFSAHLFGGNVDPRLAFKPFPVPNSALTVLIGLLGALTGFALAAKLIVLATIWTMGLLVARLIRHVDPGNAQAKSIVALSCLVLSSSLFNGYISYQIALCLLFAFFYWFYVAGGRSIWALTGFGTAIFFCHGAVFAVFVACVLVEAVRVPDQRKALAASLAAPAMLTVWYFLGERRVPLDPSGTDVTSLHSLKSWALYKAYTFAKLGPYHNFELANGSPAFGKYQILYKLGVATNVAFAGFLVTQCALAVKNVLRGGTSQLQNALAVVAFPIALFSLFLPPTAHDLVNPGERILIPAIGVLICLPGIRAWFWKPMAALVAIWLCVSAVFFLRADTNFARISAERKSLATHSGSKTTASLLDDRTSGRQGGGMQHLFLHDPYRFFYVYGVMRIKEYARPAFDTGLFYIRPEMRGFHSPTPFEAKTPPNLSYLALPSPQGSTLADALWAVDEAKRRGWDGVVTGIGTYSDPDDVDMSGLKQIVQSAAKQGLRTHLRLLEAAQAAQKDGSPSKWAVRFNGGQIWRQPYRLPLSVAVPAAKLVWQKAIDITAKAYKDAGLNPTTYVTAEAANEADMGGANGPGLGRWSDLRGTYDKFKHEWKDYLSSRNRSDYDRAKADFLTVFPEDLWNGDQPFPEGTIEPEFFTVLRAKLEAIDDRGIKIYPLTLEGQYGQVGQAEIDSYKGPDVAWLAQKYDGRAGFNRFMTVPAGSPEQCAENYSDRARYQIERMRKNPYLSGELFNTEFGMENRPSLISGNFDIADAREAILQSERQLDGIVGGGYFASFGNNKLSTGFNLYDKNRSPVGRFAVGPNMAPASQH